jgi:Zn-dependent peptidase ImmA (M78 family)
LELSPNFVRSIANSKKKTSSRVPFLEKDDLEGRSVEILGEVGYVGGEVDLDSISEREKVAVGLITKTKVPPKRGSLGAIALGRISFAELLIEIFAIEPSYRARERFTLAHELAHHLLDHSKYMASEYCDETDFALYARAITNSTDISRLEFQANYFASCLLMPRSYFLKDFRLLAKELDIHDHGFGAVYLDNQPCNVETFVRVTNYYMQRYGVSRAATKIRLQTLGLLRDVRESTDMRQVLRFFGSELESPLS